jgi:predicted phage terminase large subunit-like protein
MPAEGNLIKREWLRTYDEVPKLGGYFLSWDVAGTTNENNDYSVCTVWKVHGPNYYLIDLWRDRVEYPDLRRAVARLAEKYRPATTIIEETGLGLSLVKDLQRDPPRGMDRPVGFKPEGSKDERVAAQSAKFETGSVYLPKDASWLPDLERELLGFPHTRHDDQVDSITQFLCWYSAHRSSYEHAPIVSGFIAIHGDSFDDEMEASWSWGY